MADKALTYASYLGIDELLELQRPLSDGPEHDEMLFIVIHQVYELWFKQLLHELHYMGESLERGDATAALATAKRILTILKTVVAQVDVLETMTPLSFNSFRSRLESASGFQSSQFREFEFALGMRDPHVSEHQPEGSKGRARLEEALQRPPLWTSFLRFLERLGIPVPDECFEPHERPTPCPALHDALVALYREDPVASSLCERLVDIDEGVQEWRYRHVKMVERTIGVKPGTGGSSGVEYLRSTLFKPAFPDLWAIRNRL